ncbi:efflux RND transporter periplasmic adaptor subunit [Halofilum ochraceum]|uniref:efflux RND transporter periplasmic adaptor subunit n=1 Tax=Halofilum ochraceum TaxID=1611323 RepID=UPI0009F51FB4|nr:efflux RND transporter periplasmic adaptor subunit [Halofilum ochraceum]
MSMYRWGISIAAVAAIAAGAWWLRDQGVAPPSTDQGDSRVAVEAAPVETGSVADVRTFTGTLEAGDAFTVAPKIGAQIERIHVDIGDRVEQGQVVAELDDDEATQAVAEAEAELAVARAEVEQAQADARLARREFERTRSLAERDLASTSELDTTRARAEAQNAAVEVAKARVTQREAALARARVQLSYTRVRADWRGGDSERVVGERMVNAGDTVAANTPLVSVLGIAPITAAVFAPESDYARLSGGQTVAVTADALPGRTFQGRISRIAPRFESDSRQARFEVTLPNEDRALKPGMFVTVRVTVATADDATLVPAEAIVRRQEGPGVYRVVEGDPPTVQFVPVTVGIEGDDGVEILEPELSGRVVTLGQQMLEDDAPVIVSELPSP